MHRFLQVAAVIGFLTISGSAHATPADDLRAAEQAFSAMAGAQGHAAAYLAYLADDAADFGSGSMTPLYGRAAFEASVRSGASANPAGSVLSWNPEHVKVSGDGAMGAVDGVWTYLGPPGEHRAKLSGHYLRVWQKDAAGHWKIEADMATLDPKKLD